jgi:hypothetical protein
MKHPKSFSLSLQKHFSAKPRVLDYDFRMAFKNLKIGSLLHSCGIFKEKGIDTMTLLFWIVLVPFLKKPMTSLWLSKHVAKELDTKKDTYYRFLNNERFNWRKLIYKLATKVIAQADQTPLQQKVIIADDTISNKTGKKMELVSYHFDHKEHRNTLGYQCLQIGYHNGIQFFPLDVAFYTSQKRPNTNLRKIDKRTCGWKRRQEAFKKKTDMLIQMLQNAYNSGIDAACVLFDSWFSYDSIINKVVSTGYHVVCRLKNGNVKYQYQGKDYTLKEIWKHFAKKQQRWIAGYPIKGCCLIVSLPETGEVKLLITSDGHKKWHGFLATDLSLDASQIVGYYSRRWAIEVFFKDAKQMLYLGKEQSKTFDAAVAGYSVMMIRYLLLIYLMNNSRLIGPLGPLFRDVSDTELMLQVADQLWEQIKHAMLKSIDLFLNRIEYKYVIKLIDIIEDALFSFKEPLTAKV